MSPEEPDSRGPGEQWAAAWGQWGNPAKYWGGLRGPAGGKPAGGPAADEQPPNPRVVEGLVAALRSRLLGRELTISTGSGDVLLTLTELDVSAAAGEVTAGQLEKVTLVAEDVQWRDLKVASVLATLRNSHVRGGKRPYLVSAPVELRLVIRPQDLDEVLAEYRPQLQVELDAHGTMLLRLRQHPTWGHLEVVPDADGTRLRFKPQALVRGSHRFPVVGRLPSVSFSLPLPRGRVTLTAASTRTGAVELEGRVDEFRLPMASKGFDDLVRKAAGLGSRFDLSSWGW